jgi:uncharacterized protein (UPF0335 family)
MIKIKDYLFNESDVREIETHKKDLMVEFKDGYYEVVENATFDDIEWNYENKISESLSYDLAKARIKELEEENKNLKNKIEKATLEVASCDWNNKFVLEVVDALEARKE